MYSNVSTGNVIKEEEIYIPTGTLPGVFLKTKAWYPQCKQPSFPHRYPSPRQALLITSKTHQLHQPPLKANILTLWFWDTDLGCSRPSKALSTNTKYPQIYPLPPPPPPLFLLPRDVSATTAGCQIDSCLGHTGCFVHLERKKKKFSKISSKMPLVSNVTITQRSASAARCFLLWGATALSGFGLFLSLNEHTSPVSSLLSQGIGP